MSMAEYRVPIKSPSLFLIHGRDRDSRDAIVALVTALGIEVITWSVALDSLPLDRRDIWSVVRQGFTLSHGAIVILSPDEISWLQPEFSEQKNTLVECKPRFQARPNVLIELGYALYEWEDRTIQIVVGSTKLPSDRDGKWVLTISGNDPDKEPNVFRDRFAAIISSLFWGFLHKPSKRGNKQIYIPELADFREN